MRLGPPPAEPEVPGQFWIDFIRDTAPVFRKPHDRAARRVHRADLAGAHRRREVRQPAAARDLRRARARTSSSRTTSSAFPAIAARGRPWVRIVSCNPAEMKDPADRAVLIGLPGRGPARLAGVPRGGPPDPRRHVGRLRRVLPRARRDRAALRRRSARSSSPSRRTSTSTPTRPRPTTRATAPLGPTWHRLDSTVRAADTTWELPEHLRERDGRADLPVARLARLGGRRR